MSRPRDTRNEIIPIPALHGIHIPGAIEAQEAAGAAAMAAGDCEVIPANGSQDLTALGFALGDVDPGDKLFRTATLPAGWKRQLSDHSMWTHIVDELGRKRVAMFYKAAYYDRDAFCRAESVDSYVSTCFYEKTKPVLDDVWATRDAVREAVAGRLEEKADSLAFYEGRDDEYGRERTAELKAEIAACQALHAELTGGAAPERLCACSEFGQCPACGGPSADERLVDGPNGCC